MATLEPATNFTSRQLGQSSSYLHRTPAQSDLTSVTNGGPIRSRDENRKPVTISNSLGGMLKTTTETGDIGMFSIKPSRVPMPVNAARRAASANNDDGVRKHRPFQPYGVPSIDDRRRLPSYTRDPSSEIISMYETASQKSTSRVFDGPDYRSLSMTRAYASSPLTMHRSYTSLRGQLDAGGLVQRPRSPFAYPTRLKRPGFRPLSPALTDGDAVDYSKRAEIHRMPHGSYHHRSSPASLYARKRRPQLCLRPDGNRSTPSLLSQSSPQRWSPSLIAPQHSGTPNNDWLPRNGPTSVTSSPAHSTFSLASSMNLYQTANASSNKTTPGKAPPPPPLYYDYTEDFDLEYYNQLEPLELLPYFRVEKTIPEDRPLSSGTFVGGSDTRGHKPSFNGSVRTSSSTLSVLHTSHDSSQVSNMNTHSTSISDPAQGFSMHESSVPLKDPPEATTIAIGDRKQTELSGLGLPGCEMSTRIDDIFGLPPTVSFNVVLSNGTASEGNEDKNIARNEHEAETQSGRISSNSLNTNLLSLPPHMDGQFSETDTESGLASTLTVSPLPLSESSNASIPAVGDKVSDILATGHKKQKSISPIPLRSSSLPLDRKRWSRNCSPGKALNDLDELVVAFEEAHRKRALGNRRHARDFSDKVEILPEISSDFRNGSLSNENSTAQPSKSLSSFNSLGEKSGHEKVSDQSLKRRQRPQKTEVVTVPTISENDISDFNSHSPNDLTSRSGSPMLAPKPISPARELKLKNSVPQLMKALPAPLPDSSIRAASPPFLLTLPGVELPCRFSPFLPESTSTPSPEGHRSAEPQMSQDCEVTVSTCNSAKLLELDSVAIADHTSTQVEDDRKLSTEPPHPKLKLKMKSVSTLRSISPTDSRPWNSEDSYPWSSQDFSVGLSSAIQEDNAANPKTPKFKLRITRASNSTVGGTIRVNRESGDSRASVALNLRYPKDLLTPLSGIDNIFRQVSDDLHTRKPITNSRIEPSVEGSHEPCFKPTSDPAFLAQSLRADIDSPQPSPTSLHVASSVEVHSIFSDDSSHRPAGRHGLGRSISNLRARIGLSYGGASGTQSHDDIIWRSRNRQDAHVPSASRSIPDLHQGRAGSTVRPQRGLLERMHTHKLRTRFATWFKEATSAIKARVKSRRAARRENEAQLQLKIVV